jgi:hypothetical protein
MFIRQMQLRLNQRKVIGNSEESIQSQIKVSLQNNQYQLKK